MSKENDTPATRTLEKIFGEQVTQEVLASALSTKQQHLSRWKNARNRPGDPLTLAKLQLLGINLLDWLSPEEKKELERTRERVRRLGLTPA